MTRREQEAGGEARAGCPAVMRFPFPEPCGDAAASAGERRRHPRRTRPLGEFIEGAEGPAADD